MDVRIEQLTLSLGMVFVILAVKFGEFIGN